MRAWLYDTLITDSDLQSDLGGAEGIKSRVAPRRSKEEIASLVRPFLIMGLGNATSENLSDSTSNDPQDKDADRQFLQIWIHDDGGSYSRIDTIIEHVIHRLAGASSAADNILTMSYLETSAEFNNEAYGTIFRYIRFQAVKVRGGN